MVDIVIQKGSTFSRIIRWETAPYTYSAITAVTKAGPVAITAAAHGLRDGWRAAVSSVGGMRQLNAKAFPPRGTDFHRATRVDANTVTLNDVDSTVYTTYTSGGYLVAYTPQSLAGYTARMQVRATVAATGTPLVSLVSPTDIALDDTEHTITITISATATAAYTFASGVYSLEMVSGAGVVTQLQAGAVTITDEVTR